MLRTKVGTVELSSPLLLASGHITETSDFYVKTNQLWPVELSCAGMVTRSLKEVVPLERAQTPAPRYAVFDDGKSMLNCEWGNSVPWQYWRDYGVENVKKIDGRIIISLSGRDITGCARLIEVFDRVKVDAFEINISCSHSGALHGNLNVDAQHLLELMRKIRPLTKIPIWIKLSFSSSLVYMARMAESLGADAIVCTNSIGPGLLIDTESGLPKLGIKDGAGGVTGRAIFPIALNCVYKLAHTIDIPIVGSGGVTCADDVVQMLMAGASAVQIYTAPALQGPEFFGKLHCELEEFFAEHPQYESVESIIGLTVGKAEKHHFKTPQPTVNQLLCTKCGACVKACAFDGMRFSMVGHTFIDPEKCTGCNACVGVCPARAIKANFERRQS